MALLAEGNPATEVAQGASTEITAATYLATFEQRGSVMTTTEESAKTPGPGRGLAWAIAAFATILAVGALYLAFDGSDGQVVDQVTIPTATTLPSATTTPTLTTAPKLETPETLIARAFFDAANAYDVQSATALLNPGAHYHGSFVTHIDMYPAVFDWLRATGWQWTVDECHMKTGDANTSCAYHVENAWSRALGLAPAQGASVFEIWEGRIWAPPDFRIRDLVEAWEAVKDWISANHPTDLGAMISPGGSEPILDARSIDLWRMYTQEFVEAAG
jgi:hypothetical protein